MTSKYSDTKLVFALGMTTLFFVLSVSNMYCNNCFINELVFYAKYLTIIDTIYAIFYFDYQIVIHHLIILGMVYLNLTNYELHMSLINYAFFSELSSIILTFNEIVKKHNMFNNAITHNLKLLFAVTFLYTRWFVSFPNIFRLLYENIYELYFYDFYNLIIIVFILSAAIVLKSYWTYLIIKKFISTVFTKN